MPQQRSTVPILIVSIILGLLLSPLLERAIESWLPTSAAVTEQQSNSSSWDLRVMWY
jgi:hypothetical protein